MATETLNEKLDGNLSSAHLQQTLDRPWKEEQRNVNLKVVRVMKSWSLVKLAKSQWPGRRRPNVPTKRLPESSLLSGSKLNAGRSQLMQDCRTSCCRGSIVVKLLLAWTWYSVCRAWLVQLNNKCLNLHLCPQQSWQ